MRKAVDMPLHLRRPARRSVLPHPSAPWRRIRQLQPGFQAQVSLFVLFGSMRHPPYQLRILRRQPLQLIARLAYLPYQRPSPPAYPFLFFHFLPLHLKVFVAQMFTVHNLIGHGRSTFLFSPQGTHFFVFGRNSAILNLSPKTISKQSTKPAMFNFAG
jgi:hypothetical protein